MCTVGPPSEMEGGYGAGSMWVCEGCTLGNAAGDVGGCTADFFVLGGSGVGIMSGRPVCCWKILDS
jgi:hypothetical protein